MLRICFRLTLYPILYSYNCLKVSERGENIINCKLSDFIRVQSETLCSCVLFLPGLFFQLFLLFFNPRKSLFFVNLTVSSNVLTLSMTFSILLNNSKSLKG